MAELTEKEMRYIAEAGLDPAAALRLKEAVGPGAALESFTSPLTLDVVGVEAPVNREVFERTRDTLRTALLPTGVRVIATELPSESGATRRLGLVPGQSDADLVRLMIPAEDDYLPVLVSGRVIDRLENCQRVCDVHVAGIGPYWIELAIDTLPTDWAAFLRAISMFDADEPARRWMSEAEMALEAERPGSAHAIASVTADAAAVFEAETMDTVERALAAKTDADSLLATLRASVDRAAKALEDRLASIIPGGADLLEAKADRFRNILQEGVTRTRRVLLQWDEPEAED